MRQARHRRITQTLGLQVARNSDINLFQKHANAHFIFANVASVQLQLQGVAEVIVPIVLHLSCGPARNSVSSAERGVGSRSDSYASVSWPSVPRLRIQPGLPSPVTGDADTPGMCRASGLQLQQTLVNVRSIT